jgi:hypothetical protein
MYTRLTEAQSRATQATNARLLALSRTYRALNALCQRSGIGRHTRARIRALNAANEGFAS